MAGFSDSTENAILNHLYRNTTLTSPTTVYLALFSAAPTDTTAGTELTGNGYARQSIAFAAPSAGSIANSATVTFTAAGGAWATATSFAIFSASTAGTMLHYGNLGASKTLADGESLNFNAGSITLTLD